MTTKRPIEAAGASRRCPQSRRINCPDCGKDVATKSDGSPRGHTCPHGKSCPQLRGFACESCPVGMKCECLGGKGKCPTVTSITIDGQTYPREEHCGAPGPHAVCMLAKIHEGGHRGFGRTWS